MRIDNMTIDQINAAHPDCHVQQFDLGSIYDEASEADVRALDVIVWEDEESSEDDDGANAIARYTIRA